MKDSAYWRERFGQLEAAQDQMGADAYLEIERIYRRAQKEIEGRINTWYQRFAANNGISMAEARKMLSGDDLKEFKWDVEDYIKYGQENAVDGRWMRELENASAKFHISRLEALKLQTQQSLEVMFGSQLDSIDTAMRAIYLNGYYHTAYELQKGLRIGWDIAGIDQSQVEKIISRPWAADGKNFSERIWGNKQKLISEVHKELTQNVMLGQDPQKAIDAIARKMGTSKHNAGRLVMTEEAYFSSAAQKDCFNDLDVVQYEIVATMDSHTSEICREMDGKVFPMEDFEPGVTAPPFHVYCRSTTIPHFDDDFGQIGERAARDERTGKTYHVPADMTYKEWKGSFVGGGAKPSSQQGGAGAGKVRDAASAINDIKTYHSSNPAAGRQAFAQEVLSAMDIQNVPANIIPMNEWGYCRLRVQGSDIEVVDYNLNANDGRDKEYQIKTAFHEAYHAKAAGMKTDHGSIPQDSWLDIEETFAECSAHYLASQIGITDIAPSYPARLVDILPRLKRLPEYASCDTIADFGKIAFEERMAGVPPVWGPLHKRVMGVHHDWQSYAKMYFDEIRANADDYIDKMLENMPKYKRYRSSMKKDLADAMQDIDNGRALSSNERLVMSSVLSIAMDRSGVR